MPTSSARSVGSTEATGPRPGGRCPWITKGYRGLYRRKFSDPARNSAEILAYAASLSPFCDFLSMNNTVYKLFQNTLKRPATRPLPPSWSWLRRCGPCTETTAKPTPADLDRPLTVPQVAKQLAVSRSKVLAWIDNGRLKAFNVNENAKGRPNYGFHGADLEAFTSPPAEAQARTSRPTGRAAASCTGSPSRGDGLGAGLNSQSWMRSLTARRRSSAIWMQS